MYATLHRMIAIVVATDKNGAIGRANRIPWHIRSDFIRLANLTRGKTVIVGRRSYESMVWYYNKSGKKMPGNCYIVVTRDTTYTPAHDNARVAHSIAEALAISQSLGEEVYVIGGGSIFAAALPAADRIYLTEVQTKLDGNVDAYFKIPDMSQWHEIAREHHQKNEHDEYDTEVITLEKI